VISNIDNSDETRKLRKSRDTLIIVGRGIILFGVWSAVKLFSLAFLRTSATIAEIRETMPAEAEPISERLIIVLMLVVISIFALIEIGIRYYVGSSAIAEGRGTRSGKLYILITYFFIFTSIITLVFMIFAMFSGAEAEEGGEDVSVASAVIELTNLIMMIEMLISAHKVKKDARQKRREEAGYAA
jgi:hypothetical protein